MNCWPLNKYSRLPDSRNMPMNIERSPTNRLMLHYDETLKLLYIYNNGHQLEMFCIHPLVFAHELILKDVRILFNLKSQVDGSSSMKFRVRFQNMEAVANFSAVVSKYVGVKPYEQGGRRSSDLNLMNDTALNSTLTNSFIAGHSSAFMNVSTASTNVLQNTTQDSVKSSQPKHSPLGRSRSVGNVPILPVEQPSGDHSPPGTDASTQTDGVAPVGVQQPPVTVNVHIDSILAVEAMREFGQILREITNVREVQAAAAAKRTGNAQKKPRGRPPKPKENEQPKKQKEQPKKQQNIAVDLPNLRSPHKRSSSVASVARPARKRKALADWTNMVEKQCIDKAIHRSVQESRRSKSRTIGGYRLRGNQN